MAKMGQPMLPMTGATPSQPDTDDEEKTQSAQSSQVDGMVTFVFGQMFAGCYTFGFHINH